MCLTRIIELLVHRIEAEIGTSLAELLDVHASYHERAFPFAGSYGRLLKQQYSIPFTEYDAILLYRVLFYVYDALSSTPEQLNETIAPCVLSMLSVMFARHISPVLCALKTFMLSMTHDTFFKPIYKSKASTFLNLLHASSTSSIHAYAAEILKETLQETSYAKYIKLYCGYSRHTICCPVMSTTFIDQTFTQFISTSTPFLSDTLKSDCCSCDRSMVHALNMMKEYDKFQYLDKSTLYIPDISCGTSFGPPISCFSNQSRPGPVRLTWIPVSRTIMEKDNTLYPITKSPMPCACCNPGPSASTNTSSSSACTVNIAARVSQIFTDFIAEFHKKSRNTDKKADTLAFLKYVEAIDTKDLCSCIKRDLISAAQLGMLYELDKLLQTSNSVTYSRQSVREGFSEIAKLFSMLYYDILTLECRSTGQYTTLSASHVRNIDKSPKSSGKANRSKGANNTNSIGNDANDDYQRHQLASTIKKKRAYQAYTKAFYANNLALDLFNNECRSFKDLDTLGVSKSSAIYKIMSFIRMQNKKEATSSISKEKRTPLSHQRAYCDTNSRDGDSLICVLNLMTSSLYSLASPPPTSHPFYFSIRQLYKYILLNNAASPWILRMIEQIRTKDIQIVRHRVLSDKRFSIYECSRQCPCPLSCMRRCVQFGKRYRLQIFRQRYGYWGLRTLDYIPKGAPVCEYTGDLISENLAELKGAIADMQRCSYLYDVFCVTKYCLPSSGKFAHREARNTSSGGMRLGLSSHGIWGTYLSQEKADFDDGGTHSASDLENSTIYVIDATRAGNEGRYANHRTRNNIEAKRIIWDDEPTTSHFARPHLYFFATTDIKPMEELFLNYMYKDSDDGLIKLKYPWAFDNDTTS